MLKISNDKGFTFAEILIALSIMTIGFLAMAQMQFLSLKQKQDAELGTIATNMIQFISDRDMAEAKRVHLLNSIAYIEAQAGRLNPSDENEPHLQYCKSSNLDHICILCPCNPLESITFAAPVDGSTETSCAIISTHDFDPENVVFETDQGNCALTNDGELFIVKQVVTTTDGATPQVTTLDITYAVKTPTQFEDTAFDSVNIKDSIATQQFSVTSHREDWTEIISGGGWGTVEIPHIP
jgi:prepilin-type N-terminal cleavage/methylation domain-containing protein